MCTLAIHSTSTSTGTSTGTSTTPVFSFYYLPVVLVNVVNNHSPQSTVHTHKGSNPIIIYYLIIVLKIDRSGMFLFGSLYSFKNSISTEERNLAKSILFDVVMIGYLWKLFLSRTFFVLSDAAVFSSHNMRTISIMAKIVCIHNY
jgi:hypothetical protein